MLAQLSASTGEHRSDRIAIRTGSLGNLLITQLFDESHDEDFRLSSRQLSEADSQLIGEFSSNSFILRG
jgi:hypothetical protein